MRFGCTILFILSLFASAPSHADTHTLQNIKLEVPADFTVEVDGGTAALFNHDATLLILVLNERQDDLPIDDASFLKSALKHSRKGIENNSEFKDTDFGDVREHRLKTLTGFAVEGTAVQEGTRTRIQLMALRTPNQHMALIIVMHPVDETYRLQPLVDQVLHGIVPIDVP